MFPAINAWTFPDDLPPAEQIRAAAAAGFEGIELTIAKDGPLSPTTPLTTFAELAQLATDCGVRIVSFATFEYGRTNFGCADAALRQEALDFTRALLERARAADAEAVLVVPAFVGEFDDTIPRVSYADALHRTAEALGELRYEAEAHDVTLAIENVWNRFLLSPVELAGLIDAVNSPHVGVYFDTGNVLLFGYPEDWIRTLDHRLRCVHIKDYDLTQPGWAGFCELGRGSVNWPAVHAALAEIGYAGPLTFEGPGDPATMCGRLRSIIAGESPLATEETV